jgi:hypothetical protein
MRSDVVEATYVPDDLVPSVGCNFNATFDGMCDKDAMLMPHGA